MRTRYRTSSGTITVRTGTEGPTHDPYGYTEIEVVRAGHPTALVHVGLGVWCRVDGKPVKYHNSVSSENMERAEIRRFEEACGWEYGMINEAITRLEQKRWERMTPEDHACHEWDMSMLRGAM